MGKHSKSDRTDRRDRKRKHSRSRSPPRMDSQQELERLSKELVALRAEIERNTARSVRSNQSAASYSQASSYILESPESSNEFSQGGTPPSSPIGGTPPSPMECGIPQDVVIIDNDVKLDDEILEALGEDPHKDTKKTYELHSVVQKRWKTILTEGLDKGEKERLMELHLPPTNLTLLKAPDINPEILKAIPSNTHKKDKFQQLNQSQLGKGLAALGAGINILLKEEDNKENKNTVLGLLSESGKLLTDVHYNMSLTRRALITPTLSKTVKELTSAAPIEELLFGSNLGERIKTAKAVERSVIDLKPKSDTVFKKPSNQLPSTSSGSSTYKRGDSLNWRGPSGYRRDHRQKGQYLQTKKHYQPPTRK
ncbi:unnamed protein product [Phaedon cochleariae]|uniref:Uncharacterized protein n=1 Tax=Phaedon cochleariae TaxID=80249 RepID=A0A9N9X173_PHACE|nr:unnamed protein product [Phaedon cochleariae]